MDLIESPPEIRTVDEDGRVYKGLVPALREVLGTDIRLPRLRLKDGVVFHPPGMDWKWAIYLHDGHLYFTRSWTGRLVYRVAISRTPRRTILERIEYDPAMRTAFGMCSVADVVQNVTELAAVLIFDEPQPPSGPVVPAPGRVPLPEFATGDILRADVDVLVTTANPSFNLTGGIGACLARAAGPGFQAHVHQLARQKFPPRRAPRGSILRTGAGALDFDHVLHAVAIDTRYETDFHALSGCTHDALTEADGLGARSVALPLFATGWGHLDPTECGAAMRHGFDRALPALRHVANVQIWTAGNRDLAQFRNGWWSRW